MIKTILFSICVSAFFIFIILPLSLTYILKGKISKKDLKKIYKILFK